jgi:zinc protease
VPNPRRRRTRIWAWGGNGTTGLLLPFLLGLIGFAASCAYVRQRTSGGGPTMRKNTAPPPDAPILVAELGRLTVRKWRLGNGLVVLTVPDPSATSVSYVTTYRVGSRDEDAARHETGLAHLFEHLMFTQTRGSAAGAFDRTVEAAGGSSNAATDYDCTAYTDEIPPEVLGQIIPLEADRMVNLDLLARQVASERDVVVEERLSSVEDSVDGKLDELMYGQAFQRHPYRWPVIGRMEDIQAFTKDKALGFYRRFYAPNRAVVSVAGRFDETATIALIQSAYGGIEAARQEGDVRDSGGGGGEAQLERAPATLVSTSIPSPVPADRLVSGYRAPGLADPDRAAYEVLAEVLAGGPSSRLHRRLIVEAQLASSVLGQVPATRDPGLFAIWVQLTRGHTAEQADAVLVAEVARLLETPVEPIELDAARNRLETELWRDLGSSRGRAEMLGHFEVVGGDFRLLVGRAAAYAQVSAGDVVRVAQSYFGDRARSVVIARPTPSRNPATSPAPAPATLPSPPPSPSPSSPSGTTPPASSSTST